MKTFSMIDHTADIGIEVYGETFPSLLEHAGSALFQIITDTSKIKESISYQIDIPSENHEVALRQWLENLMIQFNGSNYLFTKFQVSMDESSHYIGKAWGEIYNPERHIIHTEIKGITYHQFQVCKTSDGWKARIIFDI